MNAGFDEIGAALDSLHRLRPEFGRAADPFEIKVLCVEAFDIDSFSRLAAMGVTEIQVVPWYFYGGDPESLDVRRGGLERFAAEVMEQFDTIGEPNA